MKIKLVFNRLKEVAVHNHIIRTKHSDDIALCFTDSHGLGGFGITFGYYDDFNLVLGE